VLRAALRGVREPLVVGGHTHQQAIRELPGGPTYVNAGSVGLPFEGRAGAFWLLLRDGVPTHR
jgi:predicted phosphodiesterase